MVVCGGSCVRRYSGASATTGSKTHLTNTYLGLSALLAGLPRPGLRMQISYVAAGGDRVGYTGFGGFRDDAILLRLQLERPRQPGNLSAPFHGAMKKPGWSGASADCPDRHWLAWIVTRFPFQFESAAEEISLSPAVRGQPCLPRDPGANSIY